ncbi:rCG54669 [Rattus norvegicus]|uniref:RCG54669 n=1 Tax=Rattus norvegicus TaxID=10116 RepID=A6KFN9_RAT|nr:rCG54669 [Rattus norvegicus]
MGVQMEDPQSWLTAFQPTSTLPVL